MDFLNEEQLRIIKQTTPQKHVYQKTSNGKKYSYVKGHYIKSVLNDVFKFNWSFEILSKDVLFEYGQVVISGKLTVRSGGIEVVKSQFGKADIDMKNIEITLPKICAGDETTTTIEKRPRNIGDDIKAATTDALKKCASELGICSDIYSDDEQNEKPKSLSIEDKLALIKEQDIKYRHLLSSEEEMNIYRIIKNKEKNNYDKVIDLFKNVKEDNL